MSNPSVATHRSNAVSGLPHPPYLRTIVRRSAALWLLARCAYVVVLIIGVVFLDFISYAEGIEIALRPTASTRVVLVALVSFLVWWDRRRSRELLLHANLGTHPGWFWGASLGAATATDLLVQAALSLF